MRNEPRSGESTRWWFGGLDLCGEMIGHHATFGAWFSEARSRRVQIQAWGWTAYAPFLFLSTVSLRTIGLTGERMTFVSLRIIYEVVKLRAQERQAQPRAVELWTNREPSSIVPECVGPKAQVAEARG